MSSPLHIGLVPAKSADDSGLMHQLASLVNTAYTPEDEGLWQPGVTRTTPDLMTDMTRASEIVTATRDHAPVGIIRVQRLDQHTGYTSMLATATTHRHQGIAGQLRTFTHNLLRSWGVTTLRIDNIAPRERDRPATTFMTQWNERAGYRIVGTTPLEHLHPDAAQKLLTPCDFIQYEKTL